MQRSRHKLLRQRLVRRMRVLLRRRGDPVSGGVLSLSERDAIELLELRRALLRIDAGAYGRCTRCAGTIDEMNLTRHPRASVCASCGPAPRRAVMRGATDPR